MFFHVAVVDKTTPTVYKWYNARAASVKTMAGPNHLTVKKITTSTVFSRLATNLDFDFKTHNKVPRASLKGLLLIEFPREFAFQTHSDLSCKPTSYEFATSTKCNMTYDRMYISGNTKDYSGKISMNVKGVLNPLQQVTTTNFLIKTFDGYVGKILESSFYNLDPVSFTYTYPGQLITVNGGNDITARSGT